MSEHGPRRGWLLAVAFGTFVVLGVLGYAFWRTLPPIGVLPQEAHAGARPFAGPPTLPSVIPAPNLGGVRAAILVEPENVRITPAGAYDAAIALWGRWIRESGGTIVSAANADVIVAPQAACLGPVDRRLVANHLAKGKGLVTTGLFGAYDGVCEPLRDTLLVSLTGIGDGGLRAAPRRKGEAHYAVVLGESVLGAGVPPGARIEFGPAGQIVFRNASRDLLYCDYERQPLSAGGSYFDAAAVRALVGPGRVAAFGFSPLDLTDDWSRSVGRSMFMNSVRWASGRPVLSGRPVAEREEGRGRPGTRRRGGLHQRPQRARSARSVRSARHRLHRRRPRRGGPGDHTPTRGVNGDRIALAAAPSDGHPDRRGTGGRARACETRCRAILAEASARIPAARGALQPRDPPVLGRPRWRIRLRQQRPAVGRPGDHPASARLTGAARSRLRGRLRDPEPRQHPQSHRHDDAARVAGRGEHRLSRAVHVQLPLAHVLAEGAAAGTPGAGAEKLGSSPEIWTTTAGDSGVVVADSLTRGRPSVSRRQVRHAREPRPMRP